MVMVPPEFHLDAAAEKAEYDKHDNQTADAGYRRFLGRCLDPVLARVAPKAQGLDFGCGEGAVLSQMAGEQGLVMANYDLYYCNDPQPLTCQYDFITLTEVIEHVADAGGLLSRLDGLLRPQGLLAVMTKRVLSRDAFAAWHYKNDLTHINFYSLATFEWIAAHFGWHLEVVDKDLVIFTKASQPPL
jgi:2-polyprenyl-3-methyl-5-hydroxy-6-metoxy-1,4-benzoquinol methylase